MEQHWAFVNMQIKIFSRVTPDRANKISISGIQYAYWMDVRSVFYEFSRVLGHVSEIAYLEDSSKLLQVHIQTQISPTEKDTFEFVIPQAGFENFVSMINAVRQIVNMNNKRGLP